MAGGWQGVRGGARTVCGQQGGQQGSSVSWFREDGLMAGW